MQSHSGHQNQELQECAVCGLLVLFRCDWAITAVSALGGGAGPWHSWLRGLAAAAAVAVLRGGISSRHSWLRGLATTVVGVLVCQKIILIIASLLLGANEKVA